MYVYATDLGFPAQNSSNEAKVIVRVTRNVHAPKFDRDLYTKSVLETVSVGSSVIKLNANDRDSAVSYSLSQNTDAMKCAILQCFVFLCIKACSHCHVSVNKYAHTCIHICMCVCLCMCVCACVYVCACVCKRGYTRCLFAIICILDHFK